jgi:hypothetical protein
MTPQVPPEGQVRIQDYVKGELSKDTNWWGAFVVGLAGTILVTGVTRRCRCRPCHTGSLGRRSTGAGRGPAPIGSARFPCPLQ